MKNYLLRCLFCLFAASSFAQSAPNTPFTGCGSDLITRLHPELREIQERSDAAAYQESIGAGKTVGNAQKNQALRTLPVVVHIIHNGGAENISDAQIVQGIAQLNDAFSAQFGTGVNTEIQFCLAQRTPQNIVSNGITRHVSALTNFDMDTQDLAVKDLGRWAPTCYMNIWVVAAINSASSGNGVVGYAYFPSSHGGPLDGIVMEAAYFGSSQSNTSVLVHEVGHYLGLYHTFEGGCSNGNCLLEGDRVCDTPPDQTTFSNCSPNANSCATDADDASANNPFTTDVPDLGEDYMDYSNLACYTRFTLGQSERMNWHITNVRSSLLACPSCQTPCPAPVTAQINTPTSSPVTINVGTVLNFNATSTNAIQYEWSIGSNPPFANTLNTAYTFNTVGAFWVIFRAVGSDPTQCSDALDSVRVQVICDAQAAFSASNEHPDLGVPVVFTNASVNATSYQWLINGVLNSILPNYTHIFTLAGVYSVALVAQNGLCADTVFQSIFVGCKDERKRANNWYFGGQAGISFASGSPVALTNSAMSTSEGVSTMSDLAGSLLFYSDGNTIWNSNHTAMPNGTGLLGSSISSQSSIIIPMPGNGDRYYVFTVPNWTDNHSELAYSIVDMNLNGGLGDVVPAFKNVVLNNNVAEQVTAAYHANCEDIWIISHEKNNNRYVAYRVSAAGVSTSPVVSAIGNTYNGVNRYGSLRVSHNGKRLCSTAGGFGSDGITVVLSDFNSTTGTVSNSVTLETTNTMPNAYSSEFSSDDKLLYVVEFNSSLLKQYDLTGGNLSQTITTYGTQVNVLQMGPDGRIYAGGNFSTSLSVIQFPNLFGGVCGFTPAAVSLSNRFCRIGLPNFFPNYFQRPLDITATNSICQSESTLIHLSSNQCNATYTWTVPTENGTIQVLSDTLVQFTSNGSSGLVTIKVVRTTPCAIDSISHDLDVRICGVCPALTVSAGLDTTICSGQSVQLQATPGFDEYHWTPVASLDDPNIADPIATPTTTTTYALDATTIGNNLIVNGDFSQGNTGFTSDYLFSFYNPCQYTVSTGLWIYAALDHTPTSDNMMMSLDGCGTPNLVVWRQTIPLTPNTDYQFSLWMTRAGVSQPSLRVIFNNVFQTVFVGIPYTSPNPPAVWDQYSLPWNSGSNSAVTIELINLELELNGNDFALDDINLRTICHYADSVTLTVRSAAPNILELGPDVLACANAVRTFDAGAGFEEYQWQNGQTDRTFTAFTAGKYWVTVRDSCGGIQSDTVRVTLSPTPTLDLGADLTLCSGDSLQLAYASNGAFTTYNWTPTSDLNCSQCADPWASPATSTVIQMAATTADGCTNTDSIKITILPVFAQTQGITRCNSYSFNGNLYTATGIYLDTLQTTLGCDSVVTTNLTILSAFNSSSNPVICLGQSVQVGANTYTASGMYVDVLQSIGGCDSIVTTNLSVLPAFNSSSNPVICQGESVQVGTNTYTISGMYLDILQSIGGCDSIVTTNLSVLPAFSSSSSPVICQGESVQVGTNTYTASGMYLDVLQTIGGCDSVVTTNLSVLPAFNSSSSPVICQGESVQVGTNTYTASGMYLDVLQTIGGCDSIVTTNLSVLPAFSSSSSPAICQGETIQVGANTYGTSGTYLDVLQSVGGCDSIINTNLSVWPTYIFSQSPIVCAGGSVTVGTNTYTTTGVFQDILQTTHGCDSIVVTDLHILPAISSSSSAVICQGESIQVGTSNYTVSGIYMDVLQTSGGCDSIVSTTLSVHPSYSISQSPILCAGESVTVGTNTYTTTGVFQDILQTTQGCDSIIVTNLSVLPVVSSSSSPIICQGEQVQVGANIYTFSGVYLDVLQTSSGCDSIISTNLTVLAHSSEEGFVTICEGESVVVNGNIYDETGIYSDTLINENGCDSILLTNLMVLDSVLYLQEYVLCDGDSVHIGGKYYVNTGIFTDVLTALNTCDSTIVTKISRGNAIYCDSLNCRVFIPNGFAPGIGGLNAYFEVYSPVFQVTELSIYDRWGDLVYQSNGGAVKWDGTFRGEAVPSGVYVYLLRGACSDGKAVTRSGGVTVVR